MAIKKRIKELQARLKQIESESQHYWIGKWVKSLEMNRIKAKIADLQKELKPNHHPKQKLDPNVE